MAEAAPEVPLPLFPLDQPFVDRHPPPPLIAVDDAYLKALERYVDILPRAFTSVLNDVTDHQGGRESSPPLMNLLWRNATLRLTSLSCALI